MMSCINVAVFVLITQLEKDHSMIEMLRLKNVVIFVQTIVICNIENVVYAAIFLVEKVK